jgi:hemolysin activation/secretion protein
VTSWEKESDKKDDSFMAKNSHHLYKINIEPFYDYGYAKTNYNGDSGRLSGAGIKTIFSSKYFDASFTYSWAISKSGLIEGRDKENKMLYFELGVKCC